MMDCIQYRRSMLAAPAEPNAQLLGHREICPACSEYTQQLLRFEERLGLALRVKVPKVSQQASEVRERRAARSEVRVRRVRLVRAASVLVAAVLAGSLWVALPGPSLAADVVTHVAQEPQSWRRTDRPVPESALSAVLRDSNLRLRPSAGLVSYASSCEFRGHQVPHLVVQSPAGPVTVMVLTHESLREAVRFEEQGYRGVILPLAGHGSLAVLTREGSPAPALLEDIAARVLAAIDWTA